MIGVKVGEVSIEVSTVNELSALVLSPEFKTITAILKNGHHANGVHMNEGNAESPTPKKQRAANGEKASRETVVGLIRQLVTPLQIAEETGWTPKAVSQLKYYLKKKPHGSDASENTAD